MAQLLLEQLEWVLLLLLQVVVAVQHVLEVILLGANQETNQALLQGNQDNTREQKLSLLHFICGVPLNRQATVYLTNKEAKAMYYTVVNHDGHLRT